ncbi:MAG: hypothetical protein EAZ70_03690 [Runella slithyformis]|nr:MAG: hypothetical protein EAY79_03325 [Runella slithyformis]TAF28922.1 MAG: hypothetical protein EAZ70_03690 [Runella slithyformis]TAF47975.1 MAG: hypothetical protein EAZ63_06535 [Runella slithyformis]TAF82461.1 MAG: hypothetical protein EAZ50_03865 [Runella slithyformis]
MKELLTFILLITHISLIKAQDTSRVLTQKPINTLDLGIGLGYTALQSKIISPFVFEGFGVPFHLTYRQKKRLKKQYIQVLFQNQALNSPFNARMDYTTGHLLYGYLRQVKKWQNGSLFLGGEWQTQISNRVIPNFINAQFFSVLHSLNFAGQLEYHLKKHQIEAQVALAVLGKRPDSNFITTISDPKDNAWSYMTSGKVETLPQYFNGTVRLTYCPPSRLKFLRWRFEYVGNYHQFRQYNFFGVLQHQLLTSLTYQF